MSESKEINVLNIIIKERDAINNVRPRGFANWTLDEILSQSTGQYESEMSFSLYLDRLGLSLDIGKKVDAPDISNYPETTEHDILLNSPPLVIGYAFIGHGLPKT